MCNLICERNKDKLEMKRYRLSSFDLAPKDCRNSASACDLPPILSENGKVLSEPEPRNAASAALINKQKDR